MSKRLNIFHRTRQAVSLEPPLWSKLGGISAPQIVVDVDAVTHGDVDLLPGFNIDMPRIRATGNRVGERDSIRSAGLRCERCQNGSGRGMIQTVEAYFASDCHKYGFRPQRFANDGVEVR